MFGFMKRPAMAGGILLEDSRSPADRISTRKSLLPPRLYYPLDFPDGTTAELLAIPGDHLLCGMVIARGKDRKHALIHATSSGRLELCEGPLPFPETPSGRMAVIVTDGLDHAVSNFPPLTCHASKDQLLERIRDCGIIGLGGGGFPSHEKILLVAKDPKLLIINAVECEPYLSCDDRLARENAQDLIRYARLLSDILQIRRTVFALSEDRGLALHALKTAAFEPGREGPEFMITRPQYPAGGERQLVAQATGIELRQDSTPSEQGILVFNLATLWAIGRAMALGEILTRRMVTVAGEGLSDPANLLAPIGTPSDFLVAQCGPSEHSDCEAFIMGGPMMGFAIPRGEVPILKTTSAILVTGPPTSDPEPQSPCIRCGACHGACPERLMPDLLHLYSVAERPEQLLSLGLLQCVECGACDLVCPSHIPLTSTFRNEKPECRQIIEDRRKSTQARARFEARQHRIEQEEIEHQAELKLRKQALSKSSESKILEALERAKKRKDDLRTAPPDGEP